MVVNSTGSGAAGGEGGVSIWTMTLTQQQEYVVNLGARIWPSGGTGLMLEVVMEVVDLSFIKVVNY